MRPRTRERCGVEPLEPRTLFAAGDLDPTFGFAGRVSTPFAPYDLFSANAATLGGGKIVVVGPASFDFGDASDVAVARYNADGSLDKTFDGDGRTVTNFGTVDAPNAVAVLSDGKILMAGTTAASADSASPGDIILARYNANGTLDTTFGAAHTGKVTLNLGGSETANALRVLSDGKFLVCGGASGDFLLAKFNANGTLDSTFGAGKGYVKTDFAGSGDVAAKVTQVGDKILVAGTATFTSGTIPPAEDFALARYNAGGALDKTFGGGTGKAHVNFGSSDLGPDATEGSHDTLTSLVVLPDGRIIAIGASLGLGDGFSNNSIGLARFSAGGTLEKTAERNLDTSSSTDFESPPSAAVLLSSGKILVSGIVGHDGEAFMARFNSELALDTTFGSGGKVTTPLGGGNALAHTLPLDSSGRALLVGAASGEHGGFGLIRFLGDSALPGPTITINGSSANDTINVTQSGANLTVKINGGTPSTFSTAGASSLVINGLDGDDTLFVNKNVTFSTVLSGGNGNDRLHLGTGPGGAFGGAGVDAVDYSDNTAGVTVSIDDVANDGPNHNQNVGTSVEIVLGGSGGDTITGSKFGNLVVGNGGGDTVHGGDGRDVLIGGTGADKLFGDAGEDLLIHGSTTYDGSLSSLRTLLSAWQDSTRGYSDRVSRLLAGTPGVKVSASTVVNDSAADTLTGGADRDWFVSHAGDTLADKAADETSTVL